MESIHMQSIFLEDKLMLNLNLYTHISNEMETSLISDSSCHTNLFAIFEEKDNLESVKCDDTIDIGKMESDEKAAICLESLDSLIDSDEEIGYLLEPSNFYPPYVEGVELPNSKWDNSSLLVAENSMFSSEHCGRSNFSEEFFENCDETVDRGAEISSNTSKMCENGLSLIPPHDAFVEQRSSISINQIT
jgi:hypothetical protein